MCEATSSIFEMKKKRILSIIPANWDWNAIAAVKLFSSNKEGKEWLYSNLEGLICFYWDYQLQTRYLILYDSFSYEKLWQYELYEDFHKCFQDIADDFRCFEVEGGFIGMQFDSQGDAEWFSVIIKKLSGMLLKSVFASTPFIKTNDNFKEKAKSFCKTLKDHFSSGNSQYDENYVEDEIEIIKARNFEILNNISFNKETKTFEIGKISEELKEIFKNAGVKKKHFKDVNIAFMLFKKIILGISGDDKGTNNFGNTVHTFPPPEERERLRKEEEEADLKINKFAPTNAVKPTVESTKKDGPPVRKQILAMPNKNNSQANTTLMNKQKIQPQASKVPPQNKQVTPTGLKPSATPQMAKQTVAPQAQNNYTKTQTTPLQQPSFAQKEVLKVSTPTSKPTVAQTVPSVPKPPTTPSTPAVPTAPSSSSVPSVPSVPGNIPAIPNVPIIPVVPIVPVITSSTPSGKLNWAEEIANMTLKKVTVDDRPKQMTFEEELLNVKLKKVTQQAPAAKIISKNESNFLQNALSMAIRNRRNQLEEEDDDSEDDDWD